eukprot:9570235-Alexandrium_andersonii.AAC.1
MFRRSELELRDLKLGPEAPGSALSTAFRADAESADDEPASAPEVLLGRACGEEPFGISAQRG